MSVLEILLMLMLVIKCTWSDFQQIDYLRMYHISEETLTSSLSGKFLNVASQVECSVMCSTLGCISFSYDKWSQECKTYDTRISVNQTVSLSTRVEYFTKLEDVVKPEDICSSDADCTTTTPSSVCIGGVCTCPDDHEFIATQGTCVRDCLSLYKSGIRSDSVYEIKPDGAHKVNVSCDMTNGGWTIFQQRFNGDINFKKANWTEAEEGFGDPNGDYWLGLKYIYGLTRVFNEIHFEMTLANGTSVYFHHTNFTIADSASKYRMKVSTEYESNLYSPADYEGFSRHNNILFSTVDQDNDNSSSTFCAKFYGPWWHYKCGIFGDFNAKFDAMRIAKVPPLLDSLFFTNCRIKIRRQ